MTQLHGVDVVAIKRVLVSINSTVPKDSDPLILTPCSAYCPATLCEPHWKKDKKGETIYLIQSKEVNIIMMVSFFGLGDLTITI
nr:hypothetical protein A5482_05675 [Cyanobacterium sp. IPPAS B-1200]